MSEASKKGDPLADPGHVFDQTNGLAGSLDGDSDGTAEGEGFSAADRKHREPQREASSTPGNDGTPPSVVSVGGQSGR